MVEATDTIVPMSYVVMVVVTENSIPVIDPSDKSYLGPPSRDVDTWATIAIKNADTKAPGTFGGPHRPLCRM